MLIIAVCFILYTDFVHITEKGANELKKIHQELDIPLSFQPDANTASIVMKHTSWKVRKHHTDRVSYKIFIGGFRREHCNTL